MPVDPWGPKVIKEATAARDKIVEGIKSLQALGQGVLQQRFQQNATVIPAQDPELTGGEEEEKK